MSINHSNKTIKEVTKLIERLDNKPSSPNSDLDPSEKDKFSAVDANVSTEISQGNTGKIDLEKYWAFERKISTVVIQTNSINLIESLPAEVSLPPTQQMDLLDQTTYKNSSSSDLITLDNDQRYLEVNAGNRQDKGERLYQFKFQVKGKECNCWSSSQDGYLRISVK